MDRIPVEFVVMLEEPECRPKQVAGPFRSYREAQSEAKRVGLSSVTEGETTVEFTERVEVYYQGSLARTYRVSQGT